MSTENKHGTAQGSRRTYSIHTYGCQMNAHESEKIAGMLESMGLTSCEMGREPDVLVLNTCCIRDSAEQRIIGHIGTLKRAKESNPKMVIAVVGCLTAQQDAAKRLRKTFPFLDIILGTADLAVLPELVADAAGIETDVADQLQEGSMRRAVGPCAYVNAMFGCDNFCSYCIVPYVRGRERSRPEDEILSEIASLASDGYREVTLLGQNVNSYQGGGDRFARLLRRAADETSIERIRFMTSHPKDMSHKLVETIRDYPKVCSHVHLPVQSGSDRVLESMNRRYTRSQYLELVHELRSAVPDIALTTDVIVGYPGEQQQDFRDTMDLLQAVQFDAAYTFVYSPRRGTRAAELSEQVDRLTKKERITELVALQNAVTRQKNAARVGRIETVLVEGRSARGRDMCGRTDGGRMVNFDGGEHLVGTFVPVRITAPRGSTLYGKLEGGA